MKAGQTTTQKKLLHSKIISNFAKQYKFMLIRVSLGFVLRTSLYFLRQKNVLFYFLNILSLIFPNVPRIIKIKEKNYDLVSGLKRRILINRHGWLKACKIPLIILLCYIQSRGRFVGRSNFFYKVYEIYMKNKNIISYLTLKALHRRR